MALEARSPPRILGLVLGMMRRGPLYGVEDWCWRAYCQLRGENQGLHGASHSWNDEASSSDPIEPEATAQSGEESSLLGRAGRGFVGIVPPSLVGPETTGLDATEAAPRGIMPAPAPIPKAPSVPRRQDVGRLQAAEPPFPPPPAPGRSRFMYYDALEKQLTISCRSFFSGTRPRDLLGLQAFLPLHRGT